MGLVCAASYPVFYIGLDMMVCTLYVLDKLTCVSVFAHTPHMYVYQYVESCHGFIKLRARQLYLAVLSQADRAAGGTGFIARNLTGA